MMMNLGGLCSPLSTPPLLYELSLVQYTENEAHGEINRWIYQFDQLYYTNGTYTEKQLKENDQSMVC